jgi:hypothetical protein
LSGHSLKTVDPFDAGMPLVVGAPRSGFTLLINVLSRLMSLTGREPSSLAKVMRCFVELGGDYVAQEVLMALQESGFEGDIVYSPNFRFLVGGPRWVEPEDPDRVCFRKYIGIRGLGDFTLITRHPRVVLQSQDIMHTHNNPSFWAQEGTQQGYRCFASMRDPVGILYSSCFSINALASEYIQLFVPPERDTDELRENLALYKLTDIRFLRGLIAPLVRYLEEFTEVQSKFDIVMRWEDLLLHPISTICSLSAALNVDLLDSQAEAIWRDIAWRNLTGHHNHNFRRGHGIVGGWRRYMVNEHLSIMREMGLERLRIMLGYGPLLDLDPSNYTPYQKRVASLLSRNEVYRPVDDPWLFEFAFNKSNLDSSAFSFRRYDWRVNTRIERSSMKDEGLVDRISDVADAAVGVVNAAILDLAGCARAGGGITKSMAAEHTSRFRKIYTGEERLISDRLSQAAMRPYHPPRLVLSLDRYNIVSYGGKFYGLPHALGPIDLEENDPTGKPGVLVSLSYDELLRALTNKSANDR